MTDIKERVEQMSKQRPNYVGWIVGVVAGSCVFAVVFWLIQPRGEPREPTPTTVDNTDQYIPNEEELASIQEAAEDAEHTLAEETDKEVIDFNQLADVNLSSWAPVVEEKVPSHKIPQMTDDVTDHVLVKMSDNLFDKQVGDQIQFTLPQREETVLATITEVNANQSDTRIIQGTLRDGLDDYPFVLTLGPARAFAYLPTSTGDFELIGNREYAWVMESEKMANTLDYTIPDHFVMDPDPAKRLLEPEPAPVPEPEN